MSGTREIVTASHPRQYLSSGGSVRNHPSRMDGTGVAVIAGSLYNTSDRSGGNRSRVASTQRREWYNRIVVIVSGGLGAAGIIITVAEILGR